MTSIRPNTFTVPQRRPHIEDDFGGNEKASGLPCPMLSTLVNEGRLVPDENGEVSLDEVRTALASVGITKSAQKFLANGGAKASETFEREVINLLKLEGSFLDHSASLGPLQKGGFNPEFLAQLKSFSSDGETVTFDDLAAASKMRILQDRSGGEEVSIKDQIIQQTEISSLFLVFGTTNSDGVKALTFDAIDSLFRDNVLPKDFDPGSVGLLKVAWSAMKLAVKQNFGSAAARAEKGLRDAIEDEQPPVDTTSMLGLSALCPAGMRPKEGTGATPEDIQSLHQDFTGDLQVE